MNKCAAHIPASSSILVLVRAMVGSCKHLEHDQACNSCVVLVQDPAISFGQQHVLH
jgi:hypothetical protein